MLKALFLFLTLVFLNACSEQNLTAEEYATQAKASEAVSDVLFDQDLSEKASYNVRKSGEVVILFTPKVKQQNYTKAVETLRKNPYIKAVYAEQDGREVCPVRF